MAPTTIALTEQDQATLEKMGIQSETAHRLGWQSLEDRSGWIAIPFKRKDATVNHSYHHIAAFKASCHPEMESTDNRCFYNLRALEDIQHLSPEDQRHQVIVITHRELDCAIALQSGWNAVSLPPMYNRQEDEKYEFVDDFPKFATVILATSEDPVGHAIRQELAIRLGWHRCKWVRYPKECKNLTDVGAKFGSKGVKLVLGEKATFMNAGGLFRMSELPEQPELPTYPVEIGGLSSRIKLRLGDLSVWTGISSMGKTLLINCVACVMAREYGWQTCFGSFEQSPRTDHQRYLRTFYLRRPPYNSAGDYQWSNAEVAEADNWIDRHFSFIVDDINSDEMMTLKWLLARVRAAATQYNAQLIIIDPWNELDHERPQGMSLTEYVGLAIKEFKRLAKQYMIHIAIVAHPAKPEKSKDGTYGIPTLYDISDSAHWFNKADIGVIVHRLEGELPNQYATLVRVAKVRYWNVLGRVGDHFLEYIPEYGDYMDAPDFQPKRKTPPAAKTTKKTEKQQKDDEQAALPIDENKSK